MPKRTLLPIAVAIACATPSFAETPSEIRGRTFARINCARCHSIDRVSPSPLKIAPPFRTLHRRYPVETLAEALAEVERRMISDALRRHGGNISRAARELGLTRRGLYLKLERHELSVSA